MWSVLISKSSDKELRKMPVDIRDSFDAWRNLVEMSGPGPLKLINGYWDHPLKSDWEGARASSLNKQWRVIYVIEEQEIKVLILKITPHDYRRKL